jgi:hypothetical protein
VRLLLVPILAAGAVETWFRTEGSHRTLLYERQDDLPFAPLPNQRYVEKIARTPSVTDGLGLRVTPFAGPEQGRRVILCLGDSITYGYRLPDHRTYPAELQRVLDDSRPGT